MKPMLFCTVILFIARSLVGAATEPMETLALGAQAPDFKLSGITPDKHTVKKFALKDFAKAKILVVVFMCNHCPTAQYYEDRLKKIVEDYKAKGIAVAAISPNDPKSVRLDELGYTDLSDSFEEMKVRAKYKKFNYPYLYDGDKESVSKAYGPVATPHAFVFDQERKLRYAGRIDDSERPEFVKVHDLRNALEALLAGRDIEVKQTKAFGCSIKWCGKAEAVNKFMQKLAADPVSVELVDAEGLKALRKNDSGKLRLVNFWATWCGSCIIEFPELVTINRMYRHRAFELVTVAANYPDEKKEVLEFLKKKQAANRNLLFGETDKYKLMEAFDPKWNSGVPYTVLISPTGEILYQAQEVVDALALKRAIVKSLKEDRFK